jgi:hypothetical protein
LVEKPEGKRQLIRPRVRWVDEEIGWEGSGYEPVAALVKMVMKLWVP